MLKTVENQEDKPVFKLENFFIKCGIILVFHTYNIRLGVYCSVFNSFSLWKC